MKDSLYHMFNHVFCLTLICSTNITVVSRVTHLLQNGYVNNCLHEKKKFQANHTNISFSNVFLSISGNKRPIGLDGHPSTMAHTQTCQGVP